MGGLLEKQYKYHIAIIYRERANVLSFYPVGSLLNIIFPPSRIDLGGIYLGDNLTGKDALRLKERIY